MPRGGSASDGFGGGGAGSVAGIGGMGQSGGDGGRYTLKPQFGDGWLSSSLNGTNPVATPKSMSDQDKFDLAAELQSTAATEGAGVHSDFLQQAIQQLQGFGGYDPYAEAGQQGLTGLQQGSTIGGLDQRINEIMGGDAFRGLVDERQRGLQGQLASSGLRRSGTALNEAAAIPLDVALGLEGTFTGRQSSLAGMGMQAI